MRIETLVIALVVVLFMSSLSSLPLTLAQQMERPDQNVDIKRFFGNGNSDTNATVGLGVELNNSTMNASPYSGTCIDMNVSMIGTTRTGINYTSYTGYLSTRYWLNYLCAGSEGGTEIGDYTPTSDSWGQWVRVGYSYAQLPFSFRFYGVDYDNDMGSGSDSYVWVCSKGFAALDMSNMTSTVAQSIPNPAPPNAVIAHLWTNLKIDSTSKIRVFDTYDGTGACYLLIVWENFLDSSGTIHLTFSIGFQLYGTSEVGTYSCGDPVYLIYNSVSATSDNFVYGVENQDGTRGSGGYVSGSVLSAWNGQFLCFSPNTPALVIKKFYLIFQDQDQSNVRYIIPKGPNDISGMNLKTSSGSRPLPPGWWIDVSGQAVTGILQLIGFGGLNFAESLIDPFGVLGDIQYGQDWLGIYSQWQNNLIFQTAIRDSGTGSSPTIPSAYMVAITPKDMWSDAALHLQMEYWIQDAVNHALTIQAVVEYGTPSLEIPSVIGDTNVTTSAVLNINSHTNSSPGTAKFIGEGSYGQDPMYYLDAGNYPANTAFYNISLGYLTTLNVTMIPPPTLSYYSLFLYAPNGILVASIQDTGGTQSIVNTANQNGNWTIEVYANSGQGFYNFSVLNVATPVLTISASPSYGGTTSPAPGQYSEYYGSSVTVTETPYSGYVFRWWLLDGTAEAGNSITVTMTADHSLTATFILLPPGGCVLSNTSITMANGKTVPVQTVKLGDNIMGYNVQTGTYVTETVTSNNCTKVNAILSINNGLLYVTLTDQPIYTDHGWVKNPQDLIVGWQIYDPIHNAWIRVQSLEKLNGHFLVYDLRATTPDTFIGNGILLDRKTGP